MTLHADALAALSGWSAPSAGQEALRQRYVEHLRAHPDGTWRSCVPEHLTASALVLSPDHSEVLLTLHAKSGRWFQFGGHLEAEDETLAGAALREGLEESGLAPGDLGLDPVPVLLDAHPVPFCHPGCSVRHLDVMYAGQARAGAVPAVSEESLDVAWWPVADLPNPELRPFADVAIRRLRSAQAGSNPSGSGVSAAADQPAR